jgi:glycosyltransferase involved in cell wall biosynthesis
MLAAPSHLEGFGFSSLEALACGTPVVSSGGGALAEVTGDAALYPDDDPGEWAGAITRLYEERAEWDALATAGVARASRFTWNLAAAHTAAVYLDRDPSVVASRS